MARPPRASTTVDMVFRITQRKLAGSRAGAILYAAVIGPAPNQFQAHMDELGDYHPNSPMRKKGNTSLLFVTGIDSADIPWHRALSNPVNFPFWVASTDYVVGDRVEDGDHYWVCAADNPSSAVAPSQERRISDDGLGVDWYWLGTPEGGDDEGRTRGWMDYSTMNAPARNALRDSSVAQFTYGVTQFERDVRVRMRDGSTVSGETRNG